MSGADFFLFPNILAIPPLPRAKLVRAGSR